MKPLEEIFRAKILKMLKEEGKIDDNVIHKLMNWKHSGFSVHNKARVTRDDEKGREALAQYIIRNTFSLEKQWRDCIKKIYEADPLCCPKCGGEMKIISFITDQQVIRQILKHLGLWTPTPSRDPPDTKSSPKNHELVYEFFDDLSAFNAQADGCPGYDESRIAQN